MHVNDTPAIQNSGILQFSETRPQILCNIIIPWSIKYMWSNAAHSLLILTTPNCSLIRGHFPVWYGGRCTAPGGVGLRTMSGRLRAASGRCPDGSGRLRVASGRLRTVPDGSGRLLVGPQLHYDVTTGNGASQRYCEQMINSSYYWSQWETVAGWALADLYIAHSRPCRRAPLYRPMLSLACLTWVTALGFLYLNGRDQWKATSVCRFAPFSDTWGFVGSLMIVLLQIFSWFWQWNNYENRLIVGKVNLRRTKKWCQFFGHLVYNMQTPCCKGLTNAVPRQMMFVNTSRGVRGVRQLISPSGSWFD